VTAVLTVLLPGQRVGDLVQDGVCNVILVVELHEVPAEADPARPVAADTKATLRAVELPGPALLREAVFLQRIAEQAEGTT